MNLHSIIPLSTKNPDFYRLAPIPSRVVRLIIDRYPFVYQVVGIVFSASNQIVFAVIINNFSRSKSRLVIPKLLQELAFLVKGQKCATVLITAIRMIVVNLKVPIARTVISINIPVV